MSKKYISFSCVGEPTDPSKCTTRWPDSVSCSIPMGGSVSGSFYNIMVMTGDDNTIASWISENSGKVEEITKEQADSLGQAIVVPGTERVVEDMITKETTTMVAGSFDVDHPELLWTVKP